MEAQVEPLILTTNEKVEKPEYDLTAELKENIDYALVPIADDPDSWGVRILKGIYIETVIRYNTISFNKQPGQLAFNFNIIYSPNEELTIEDRDLQIHAGKILEAIIELGIQDGSVTLTDTDAK